MLRVNSFALLAILAVLLSNRFSVCAEMPSSLFTPPDGLFLTKQRMEAGDPRYVPALPYLVRTADRALSFGPYTVTADPENVPPSGDIRDYMSVGIGSGLDFGRNDLNSLYGLQRFLPTLGMAYYLTDDERYAQHAAGLVRTFFLDEATRMNPNGRYSFAAPGPGGEWPGTHFGFATASVGGYLVDVFDSVGMFRHSPAWTDEDDAGFRQWSAEMGNWIRTSPEGLNQFEEPYNHGTSTELQLIMYAHVAGDAVYALELLNGAFERRIAPQIDVNGFQPLEAVRSTSFDYHLLNLNWLVDIAILGEEYGLDIWNMKTADGRGLRLAVDALIPYATGAYDDWPYRDTRTFDRYAARAYQLFRKAELGFNDSTYGEIARSIELEYPIFGLWQFHPKLVDLGWGVDDPHFGDVNGDGFFDNRDEYALGLAISDPAAFAIEFPEVNLIAGDLNDDNQVDEADLELFLTLPFAFGDTNRDGVVDIDDLNNVRNNFANEGPGVLGDTDGDNVVDIDDLNLVRNNFGYRMPAVPEPTSLALGVAGIILAFFARRRQRG